MTATKTALTAGLAALCAALAIAAAPQAASAATATCAVTKAHIVKKVAHRTLRRPVAVAAYRESAPAPRTVVETRYVHEPAPVVVSEPVYYDDDYYAGYPIYLGYGGYGYGYGRGYYGRGYYGHGYAGHGGYAVRGGGYGGRGGGHGGGRR